MYTNCTSSITLLLLLFALFTCATFFSQFMLTFMLCYAYEGINDGEIYGIFAMVLWTLLVNFGSRNGSK